MADEALIAQLVGAELSGVVFVKDYLQLGKSVIQAEVRSGHSMDLRLSDGSSIAVSLRPEDYVGPEAINLWLRDGTLVVL
jgi:hypothetical protein